MREVTDIDKIQLEFMPGRVAVDVVLVLSRLTENLRAKKKKRFFMFVDMEKAFDGCQGKSFALL